MQSMNLELTLIMPELIIASAICLLILVNSFLTSEKRYTGLIIGSITMAACALISMVFNKFLLFFNSRLLTLLA